MAKWKYGDVTSEVCTATLIIVIPKYKSKKHSHYIQFFLAMTLHDTYISHSDINKLQVQGTHDFHFRGISTNVSLSLNRCGSLLKTIIHW